MRYVTLIRIDIGAQVRDIAVLELDTIINLSFLVAQFNTCQLHAYMQMSTSCDYVADIKKNNEKCKQR